ncbi:hypothetical protein M513_07015 [Trichuris suis]|uniref:Uncharacterized protein n=1 Tax=Trichuris suis TaxID=68888 RepID=A0A085M4M4_9BILA|nr:hypothetical protein M513_07015 [Trichuris suis]
MIRCVTLRKVSEAELNTILNLGDGSGESLEELIVCVADRSALDMKALKRERKRRKTQALMLTYDTYVKHAVEELCCPIDVYATSGCYHSFKLLLFTSPANKQTLDEPFTISCTKTSASVQNCMTRQMATEHE